MLFDPFLRALDHFILVELKYRIVTLTTNATHTSYDIPRFAHWLSDTTPHSHTLYHHSRAYITARALHHVLYTPRH